MPEKIRILYIDDYELDRELVKDALEKEHGGFEVIEAANQQEFEALLENCEVDVVLSDFNIAGFEGLRVLEFVRAHDPRIPVIIVTGTGSEEIAVRALKLGASDYVIKRRKHIEKLPQTIFATIEKQALSDQRAKAESSLLESEEKFRSITENSFVGVYIIQDGIFVYANPKFAEIFGYAVAEILNNRPFRQIVHPEDFDTVQEQIHKRISGEAEFVQYAFRGIKKDGTTRHVEVFGSLILLNGKPAAVETILDITERKQKEAELVTLNQQLKVSNQQLQMAEKSLTIRNRIAEILLTIPDEHMYDEVLKVVLDVMESRYGVFGYFDNHGALVVPSMTRRVWDQCNVSDKKNVFPREAWGESSWPRAIRDKTTIYSNDPSANIPPGHIAIRRHISLPLVHYGKVVGLFQVANKETDYTPEDVASLEVIGRMVASILDARLRRDEYNQERERLLFAIEQAGDMIVITDPQGAIQYVNPAFERTTGYGREESRGKNLRLLKSGKQDQAFYRNLWKTISSGKTFQGRLVNRRKDGTFFTEEATISPVRDASGQIVNYVAVKHDITEHLRLTAQFQQAQKMESVGRLAGGVAHDYNNMLSVILGFSELAADKVDPDDPLHADLQEITKAAKRATEITRQLLAFARKQVIAPDVLDVNANVGGMLKMLRRLIGEDIALSWRPEADLWPVNMDPSQLDQILANLCVNARDAIADIGNVIIETHAVTFDAAYCAEHPGFAAGDFVMLAVSDDGCGIDMEDMEKIFEPFFTTKAPGRGTGLGLATVYGIVKQNNGFINVYSEPDKGSTFKIYLPRHIGEAAASVVAVNDTHNLKGKGETVLVVEDDQSVLKLADRILQGQNYTVLTANTSGEALRLAAQYASKIQMLITDVVMPEMNGRKLANHMQSICPNLKTLFMSGYTADAIDRLGVLDEGVNFIQKPFSSLSLATAVRKVLDV